MSDLRWIAEHHQDGVLLGRVGRVGPLLVAEWTGIARLSATREGELVSFEAEPTADPRHVEKIRCGSAELLLRHLRGRICLHGSSAALGDRAAVFIGSAGAGKSTLAAALCRRGAALLGDDAVALEASPSGYTIPALERAHWLDAAACEALGAESCPRAVPGEKARIETRRGVERARLVAIVDLVFDDRGSSLVRLTGVEALAVLLSQVVRFVVDEPEASRREMDALAELVGRVPIYRLARTRDFGRIEEGTRLVLDTLAHP